MSSPSSPLISLPRRGITLLPLLLGLLFLYIYLTFPITAPDEPVPELQLDFNEDRVLKTDDENLVKRLDNSCDPAAG